MDKPPIGIIPEIIFKEKRLMELSTAIHEYIVNGFFGGQYSTQLQIWCEEL